MAYYRIGPKFFKFDIEFNSYQNFIYNSAPHHIDFKSHIVSSAFSIEKFELVLKLADVSLWKNDQTGEWIFQDYMNHGWLKISSDYSDAEFYSNSWEYAIGYSVYERLSRYYVQYALINSGFLVLHASCIKLQNTAIAFTAASGVGKSTRAELWVKKLEAEWISGDKPIVDPENKLVFGAPWDGKEKIYRNISADLGIILCLKRSQNTYIHKMSKQESIKFLLTQLTFPLWDKTLVSKYFQSTYKLVAKTPIYCLYCDKTESAARETYEIVFNYILNKENKMKLNPNFSVIQIADDYMVIPTNEEMNTFGGVVAINETAAFILNNAKTEVSIDDLVRILMEQYNVTPELARKDAQTAILKFKQYNIIVD